MRLPSALFQYFRECLLTDFRSLSLLDLYGSRVELRYFLTGNEMLMTGEMPWYPLPGEYAQRVLPKIQLYQREKQFYYCSLVLVGKGANSEPICAPLQLVPVRAAQREEGVIAELQTEQNVLNLPALQQATGLEPEQLQQLAQQWPEQLDEAGALRLARLLEKHCPQIALGHLYRYPDLLPERQLKQALKQQTDTPTPSPSLQLLPLSFFALISMSEGISAIETDLQQLAKQERHSAPLQALFGQAGQELKGHRQPPIPVELLSEAQLQALENAGTYSLSQITGPPGTGKSFTIANLAVSQLALGKSVLVVAKTDAAADVVYNMIERLLPELKVCLRAGGNYKAYLKNYLRDTLSGLNKYTFQQKSLTAWNSPAHLAKIDQDLNKRAFELQQRLEQQLEWGLVLKEKQDAGTWLSHLKESYLKFRYQHKAPVWQLAGQVEELQQRKLSTTKKIIQANFLEKLIQLLKHRRQELSNFYAATRARRSGEQQEYWQQIDFGAALDALPIWVVTLKDLGEVLPLKPELFDLLLVDEATQCDIASCLPALQRAKRAVVVGDPQQLRHLSFLATAEQERLQQKWELQTWRKEYLDYRHNSLLDLVMLSLPSQQQLVLLNEHYRSHPSIIAFSNQHFYADQLHIMTDLPDQKHRALEASYVKGVQQQGINVAEAEALLKWLKQKIKEEKKLEGQFCSSLGVLSPFREQTDYLAKRLAEEIPPQDLEKHQIRVATPYGFQGEERDVMLISLTLDPSSHATAWRHLSKPEVLNVAITRARHHQCIFHSVLPQDVPQLLVRQYLSQACAAVLPVAEVLPYEGKDAFLHELMGLLKAQGLSTWPAHAICGLELDLLVKTKRAYFGIDLIGYPGQHEAYLNHKRYQQLGRIGIKVFPMPYVNWYYKQEEALAHLLKFMGLRKKSTLNAE